jgi:hypothetical protein
MRAFADKLIEVLENNTKQIAEQWSKAVSTNPRTPSYHSLNPDQYIPHALFFYGNIRKFYYGKMVGDEEPKYFQNFAESMYKAGVPLDEVIYALMLMRRQIWLYADFNALFVTTLDMHQAVESINRTILIFDHVIHSIAKRYGELAKARK